jgi:tetratricopeptide (TPR) repeat protein
MSLSSPSKAINIFFSYDTLAHQDQRMFDQLINHLSPLKRQHLIDRWYDSAISIGKNITQFIEQCLNEADIIVLLVSATFLASDRCYEHEMKLALQREEAGKARVIPVLLSSADWDGSPLKKYSPLPRGGTPIKAWSDRERVLTEVAQGIRQVVEELAKQEKPADVASPSPKTPLSIIPYRPNQFFTDREIILANLSTTFASTRHRQTPILALNGLPGIGKTEIALEYLHNSDDLYQTILWLNASSREALSTDIHALADQLALPERDRKDEHHLFAAIKDWLQNQPAWLLVLDQIEDLTLTRLLVPHRSNGHVLLTTRAQALGNFASPILVETMTPEASILFLLQRANILPVRASLSQVPSETVQQATAIVQKMDGFPLALDQAGAYLQETGCSLGEYLSLYQQERPALLSLRGKLTEGHSDSVVITLSLAFEKVQKIRAENLNLLYLLAFLRPDTIPDDLLKHGAAVLDEPLRSLATHPLILYQTLADLRRFSLIHHKTETTMLSIHRVVQDVLIDTLTSEQQQQYANAVVRLVNAVFPEVSFETGTECARYLPQAQHCITLIRDFQLTLPEALLLLQRLGSYCYQRACYTEAEAALTEALRLHEYHNQSDSLEAARTLNALGRLYHRQNRPQEAEEVHRQALRIREQILGPEHPTTAESLHNLAALYGSLEQFHRAEQLYLRALVIEEQTRGPEHLEIAKTLNNLGSLYYKLGDYSQAQSVYTRALAIYERLSPNRPDIMYLLNNLGMLFEKHGDYTQAEQHYRRALTIAEKAFGEEHPETALSINKLADIYETMGNYQAAEAHYRRALLISEQILGPDHADVALFLNNLGFLVSKQGDYPRAEPFFQRALTIYEQTLGPDHSTVASVLANLGKMYQNMKNVQQAELFLRRAVAIRKQALGPAHPDTARSLSNLAELLTDQHAYEEAAELFQQALAITLQQLSPDHPNVKHIQEKYAALLELRSKEEESRQADQSQEDH